MLLLLCIAVPGHLCNAYADASGVPVCETSDDAGNELRKAMTERSETVRICLLTDTAASETEPVIEAIFEKALEHTGEQDEGDYLRFQYEKCSASACPFLL